MRAKATRPGKRVRSSCGDDTQTRCISVRCGGRWPAEVESACSDGLHEPVEYAVDVVADPVCSVRVVISVTDEIDSATVLLTNNAADAAVALQEQRPFSLPDCP